MKKKIFAICLIALLATGCGEIPKLANGEDAVVTYKDGDKISVDDLYEYVKDSYALQGLITLSDIHLLEKEFSDYKDEAKTSAEAYIKALVEQYESEETFLQTLQQYGYSTKEAYQDYVYLSYLQQHAMEEYAKIEISEKKQKEIQKYYDNTMKGDVEVSHILVTPDIKDDMSDSEKDEAKTKAQDTVKEIIEKLKNASDVTEEFKSLVKEYSEDENTKEKDGSLGRITYGDLDDTYNEILDAAYKLNDGEFSKDVITTELGYHVILKTKSYEKESFEDLKDEIIEKLAKDYISNTATISVDALRYYRDKNEMKITDEELQKQYNNYLQNLISRYNSSNTSTN